jgi:hypothetical protein
MSGIVRRMWRDGGSARLRLAGAILLPALLAGCEAAGTTRSPTVAEVEAFVGASLPPGIRDLHAAEEAGIDRLMRLRFDAPAGEVDVFAARLVPGGLTPGLDPGLTHMGDTLDWWIDALPPGAAGGSATNAANRSFRLVSAPAAAGFSRVWLVAFTQ